VAVTFKIAPLYRSYQHYTFDVDQCPAAAKLIRDNNVEDNVIQRLQLLGKEWGIFVDDSRHYE
jgi:hypothetical protein